MLNYTLNKMSVSIVSTPERPLAGIKYSKWNAIHHPVNYVLQREDFPILFITAGTSSITVLLVSATTVAVDDYVYIRSGNYDGSYKVTSVFGQLVTLLATPNGNAVGGFMNADTIRENYYLSVKVYTIDSSNSWVLRSTRKYYPDKRGVITADIAPALKQYATLTNTCDYNEVNSKQEEMGGACTITYKECWIGSANSFTGITSIPRKYYLNAAKQYLDQFGQNMGEHVPSLEGNYAKFLGAFERPTYFPGYPFAQSFILSDLVAGKQITRELEFKDVNSALNTAESEVINNDQFHNSRLNHITIDTGEASAPSVVIDHTVDLWLECDPNILYEAEYFEADLVDVDYIRDISTIPAEPSNPVE